MAEQRAKKGYNCVSFIMNVAQEGELESVKVTYDTDTGKVAMSCNDHTAVPTLYPAALQMVNDVVGALKTYMSRKETKGDS